MIILGGIIMKLAFSTLGCPDWSFDEITATAKALGCLRLQYLSFQKAE